MNATILTLVLLLVSVPSVKSQTSTSTSTNTNAWRTYAMVGPVRTVRAETAMLVEQNGRCIF